MTLLKSKRILRLATVAVTAVIAVGAGRSMQTQDGANLDPLRRQAGFLAAPANPSPAAAAPAAPSALVDAAPVVLATAGTAGLAPMPTTPAEPAVPTGPVATGSPEAAVILPAGPGEEIPDTPFLYLDGKPACPADLKVTAVPGGMVYLSFDAPCQRGKPVTLGHAGLRADLAVPGSGRLAQTLPVLDASLPFTVTLLDGAVIDATLPEPSATAFDHVILQWRGDLGLELHALEFGALHGDPGHVWRDAPKEALRAMRGEGGFMTRLGDPLLGGVAEVYSFPVGEMERRGQVEISVEAAVTATNCGRDIGGQILQRSLGGGIASAEITFAVPDCDAVGDILVLKNILQDLKIAAN